MKEILQVAADIAHDHVLSFDVAQLHFIADLLEDNNYSMRTATPIITL